VAVLDLARGEAAAGVDGGMVLCVKFCGRCSHSLPRPLRLLVAPVPALGKGVLVGRLGSAETLGWLAQPGDVDALGCRVPP
jgi:hypothetical protein